jgi:hypothetical protein
MPREPSAELLACYFEQCVEEALAPQRQAIRGDRQPTVLAILHRC